jgi:hypothetical protein
MGVPSIKGSALSSVVEDVNRLRAEGAIADETLEKALAPEDVAILAQEVQTALWYPIESYRRLTELLLGTEGRGDPAYVIQRGERAGERLFDAGIYVQLQHGEEKARASRRGGSAFHERDGRLMVSLSGAMFNFTAWEYRLDGDAAIIEVKDAADFPEVSRWAVQGFLQYTVSRLREMPVVVESERPAPDRVVYRFDRGDVGG